MLGAKKKGGRVGGRNRFEWAFFQPRRKNRGRLKATWGAAFEHRHGQQGGREREGDCTHCMHGRGRMM